MKKVSRKDFITFDWSSLKMGDWIQGVGEITSRSQLITSMAIGEQFKREVESKLNQEENNPTGRRCSYYKDINGNMLYEGNKVKYNVTRSIFYKENTKDDKKVYRINGTIIFREYKGGKGVFKVKGDEKEVAELKACRGKERIERDVMDAEKDLEHLTSGDWSRNNNLEKISDGIVEFKQKEKGYNRIKAAREGQQLRREVFKSKLGKIRAGGKDGQKVRNLREAAR